MKFMPVKLMLRLGAVLFLLAALMFVYFSLVSGSILYLGFTAGMLVMSIAMFIGSVRGVFTLIACILYTIIEAVYALCEILTQDGALNKSVFILLFLGAGLLLIELMLGRNRRKAAAWFWIPAVGALAVMIVCMLLAGGIRSAWPFCVAFALCAGATAFFGLGIGNLIRNIDNPVLASENGRINSPWTDDEQAYEFWKTAWGTQNPNTPSNVSDQTTGWGTLSQPKQAQFGGFGNPAGPHSPN